MPRPKTYNRPDGERELLDVAGAAEYLATTQRHVRSLVYRRAVPFTKVGPLLRFDRAELDAWLDAHAVDADGGAA